LQENKRKLQKNPGSCKNKCKPAKKTEIVAKIHEKLQKFLYMRKALSILIHNKNKIRTIVRIFSVFPLLYGKLFIEIKRNGGL